MKVLNVQVQPDRGRSIDLSLIERSLRRLGARKCLVTRFVEHHGNDGGPYVNFTYGTKDPRALWLSIRRGPLGRASFAPALRTSSIVVCQGTHGWDDFRLLHHFDGRRRLDEI